MEVVDSPTSYVADAVPPSSLAKRLYLCCIVIVQLIFAVWISGEVSSLQV